MAMTPDDIDDILSEAVQANTPLVRLTDERRLALVAHSVKNMRKSIQDGGDKFEIVRRAYDLTRGTKALKPAIETIGVDAFRNLVWWLYSRETAPEKVG